MSPVDSYRLSTPERMPEDMKTRTEETKMARAKLELQAFWGTSDRDERRISNISSTGGKNAFIQGLHGDYIVIL